MKSANKTRINTVYTDGEDVANFHNDHTIINESANASTINNKNFKNFIFCTEFNETGFLVLAELTNSFND